MNPRYRSRIILAVVLVGIVALLWQCTGAFDSDEDPKAIDVFGPWLGEEADAFAASMDEFTFATDVTVNYTGSSDFDSDLRERVSGGLELPDIAFLPQPALFAELAQGNLLVPFTDETTESVLENYPFEREQLADPDGEVYNAPYRTNVKSLVWYRPDVFENQGWEIPSTLEELLEFSREVATTDIAPWCFSLEAGAATGWPASDWIEDLVLRIDGPDLYDAWASGEAGFIDLEEAFVFFEDLLLAPGHTVGGARQMLSTPVDEAGLPLFGEEPECAMYKQATFATGWFPDDVEVGDDVDFFVLPDVAAAGDEEPPLLTGGTGAVQFSDRPEVSELMTYLATPEGSAEWASRGGYLSRRDSVGADYYADSEDVFVPLVIRSERVTRFDASDTFPSNFRDEYLARLTSFIGDTSFVGSLAELDAFLQGLDEVREAITEGT